MVVLRTRGSIQEEDVIEHITINEVMCLPSSMQLEGYLCHLCTFLSTGRP